VRPEPEPTLSTALGITPPTFALALAGFGKSGFPESPGLCLSGCMTEATEEFRGASTALRRWLLGSWLCGTLGVGVELWLMGHVEGFWQLFPLCLVGAGWVALPFLLASRRPLPVRLFRGLMIVFLVTGPIGMVQHYRAKSEFQREVDPSLAGWELFHKCMTGHSLPPVLAAGAMTLLGLVGWAWASSHTLVRRLHSPLPTTHTSSS